jgi:hypothetical protein
MLRPVEQQVRYFQTLGRRHDAVLLQFLEDVRPGHSAIPKK